LLPIFTPNNIVHISIYHYRQRQVLIIRTSLHKNLFPRTQTNAFLNIIKKNSEGDCGEFGGPIAGGFSTLLVISNWEISIRGYSCLHRYILSSLHFHRDSLYHRKIALHCMQHLKEIISLHVWVV
jgi:hypothetical protein